MDMGPVAPSTSTASSVPKPFSCCWLLARGDESGRAWLKASCFAWELGRRGPFRVLQEMQSPSSHCHAKKDDENDNKQERKTELVFFMTSQALVMRRTPNPSIRPSPTPLQIATHTRVFLLFFFFRI